MCKINHSLKISNMPPSWYFVLKYFSFTVTVMLYSSLRMALMCNDTNYSVPFMTLWPVLSVFVTYVPITGASPHSSTDLTIRCYSPFPNHSVYKIILSELTLFVPGLPMPPEHSAMIMNITTRLKISATSKHQWHYNLCMAQWCAIHNQLLGAICTHKLAELAYTSHTTLKT
jgi:hypothetical protein